jgi:hypothetical protein
MQFAFGRLHNTMDVDEGWVLFNVHANNAFDAP